MHNALPFSAALNGRGTLAKLPCPKIPCRESQCEAQLVTVLWGGYQGKQGCCEGAKRWRAT